VRPSLSRSRLCLAAFQAGDLRVDTVRPPWGIAELGPRSMVATQPVVIYQPAEDGRRRVRVDDRFVGLADGLLDVVELLRLAGLDDVDVVWVQCALIEWRGGGKEDWVH